VFVLGIVVALSSPIWGSAAAHHVPSALGPTSHIKLIYGFEPHKAWPKPTAPSSRPILRELDCDFGGGAFFLSGNHICLYSNTWPGSVSWTGEVIDDDSWDPLTGAVVVLHLDTMEEPLITLANRWGQFAFVNLPQREHTITCGSQAVVVPGYGIYLQKRLWLGGGGRYGQTLPMYEDHDQVSADRYHAPKRCLKYRSPMNLRELEDLRE
jgi:hypothetical protein